MIIVVCKQTTTGQRAASVQSSHVTSRLLKGCKKGCLSLCRLTVQSNRLCKRNDRAYSESRSHGEAKEGNSPTSRRRSIPILDSSSQLHTLTPYSANADKVPFHGPYGVRVHSRRRTIGQSTLALRIQLVILANQKNDLTSHSSGLLEIDQSDVATVEAWSTF